MIQLTIVSNVNRRARNENGENAGVIEAGGIHGAVLDLKADQRNEYASLSDEQTVYSPFRQ